MTVGLDQSHVTSHLERSRGMAGGEQRTESQWEMAQPPLEPQTRASAERSPEPALSPPLPALSPPLPG